MKRLELYTSEVVRFCLLHPVYAIRPMPVWLRFL